LIHLLDANVCINILRERVPPLLERFRQSSPLEVCLCSVVKGELFTGARKSSRPERNLRALEELFAPFLSYPFDDRAAEEYGHIRSQLELTGKLIGPNDLMIAAIARSNGLTLVTHNVDEFSRVSDLAVEDWDLPL
jgi:tRNA(fMet)-specific endonuclease VapC